MPSEFYIETIEPSDVIVIEKPTLLKYEESHPSEREKAAIFMADRMINYTHQFLSRIKDRPEVRYEELQRLHPEILQRMPQHYIASYLGITPVSLFSPMYLCRKMGKITKYISLSPHGRCVACWDCVDACPKAY